MMNIPIEFSEAIKDYVNSANKKLAIRRNAGVDYSKYTPRKRGYQAIKFCEFLVENKIYSFSEVGQATLDQYAEKFKRKDAERSFNFLNYIACSHPNLRNLKAPRFKRPAAWTMCEPKENVEKIIAKSEEIKDPGIRLCILFLALYGQTISKSVSLKIDAIQINEDDLYITFHKHPIKLDKETRLVLLLCHPNIINSTPELSAKIIPTNNAINLVRNYLFGSDAKKIRNAAILNIIKCQKSQSLVTLSEALDVSMPTLIWLAQSTSTLYFDR